MTGVAHIRIKGWQELVGHYEDGNRLWMGFEDSFAAHVAATFEGETATDFINAANLAICKSKPRYGSDTRYYAIPIVDEMKDYGAVYGDVLLADYHSLEKSHL